MWVHRSTGARWSIGLVIADLVDRHRGVLHGVHAAQQGFGISPQPAVSLLELVSDLDAAPAVHRAAEGVDGFQRSVGLAHFPRQVTERTFRFGYGPRKDPQRAADLRIGDELAHLSH